MAYSFRQDDATLTEGLRRIARDQLARAVAALDDAKDIHAGVHDARKRVKKLRGLIRLVRPAFPEARAENATLRDAARTLSDLRDQTALMETLDRLEAAFPDRIDRRRTQPLRRRFEAARDAAMAEPGVGARIVAFQTVLRDTRERAAAWRLEAEGWEAIGPGLTRILDRSRKAMAAAHKTGLPEDFHDWRKRVKDHGYHARLLRHIWPAMMEPHAGVLGALGDRLGEQHDLVTFAQALAAAEVTPELRVALEESVAEARLAQEAEALALGARLHAETSGALARRWGAWWAVWRAEATGDQAGANSPASAASISAMLSSIP